MIAAMEHSHSRAPAAATPAEMSARLDAAAEACTRRGAQLTELRRHVLGLVLEADGPLTAYQLLDRLKETRGSAAPPTVYRALQFLMEQGLVHRLERLNAFIPCTDAGADSGDAAGHHHHPVQFLICRKCGRVAEIDDPAISEALSRAAERQGFHPGTVVVELEGTCAACAEAPR